MSCCGDKQQPCTDPLGERVEDATEEHHGQSPLLLRRWPVATPASVAIVTSTPLIVVSQHLGENDIDNSTLTVLKGENVSLVGLRSGWDCDRVSEFFETRNCYNKCHSVNYTEVSYSTQWPENAMLQNFYFQAVTCLNMSITSLQAKFKKIHLEVCLRNTIQHKRIVT